MKTEDLVSQESIAVVLERGDGGSGKGDIETAGRI